MASGSSIESGLSAGSDRARIADRTVDDEMPDMHPLRMQFPARLCARPRKANFPIAKLADCG